MPLTPDEIDRYARQAQLPEWGAAGQERVRAARVAITGTGPAARAATLYLGAAGVGTIHAHSAADLDDARAINPRLIVVRTEDAPAVGLTMYVRAESGDGARIASPDPREAVGAACAVEALKSILGLRYQATVEVPSPWASASPA